MEQMDHVYGSVEFVTFIRNVKVLHSPQTLNVRSSQVIAQLTLPQINVFQLQLVKSQMSMEDV